MSSKVHTGWLFPNPLGQLQHKILWRAGAGAVTGWLVALDMWPACDTACMSHTVGQASAICSRENVRSDGCFQASTRAAWAACEQHSSRPLQTTVERGDARGSKAKHWFCR